MVSCARNWLRGGCGRISREGRLSHATAALHARVEPFIDRLPIDRGSNRADRHRAKAWIPHHVIQGRPWTGRLRKYTIRLSNQCPASGPVSSSMPMKQKNRWTLCELDAIPAIEKPPVPFFVRKDHKSHRSPTVRIPVLMNLDTLD